MNADGSNQTRLTDNTALDLVPSWSPDGSKIIFMSTRDGNQEIYVMDADGLTGDLKLSAHQGDHGLVVVGLEEVAYVLLGQHAVDAWEPSVAFAGAHGLPVRRDADGRCLAWACRHSVRTPIVA